MSISIIYPIDFDSYGNPVTPSSSAIIKKTSLGCTSFADSNPAEAIKQNLKMLLLTRKGEYVMDPNYGVGLPNYLFLMEQEIKTGELENDIRTQSATYLPYMTISDLNVELDATQAALKIRIEFFYNELTIPEVFELEVI
jgi:phage baseplate assembly protein W